MSGGKESQKKATDLPASASGRPVYSQQRDRRRDSKAAASSSQQQCSAVTEGLREVRSDRRVGNACAPASATSETNDVICWTMITQAHGLHGMDG